MLIGLMCLEEVLVTKFFVAKVTISLLIEDALLLLTICHR